MKISQGCYLGYRKISGRSGTWIARFRDRLTKQIYKSLGPADDVLDADAATALNFEQAQIKARAWFQSVAARDSSIPLGGTFTVAQATRMVELHYGHLAASFVRETIKATAPTFGFQVNTNVVGLT